MDALILEDYPYWWQQWSRTPHGSSLTARPELKWKYFKDLHTTKIVFHMWHILSGKDLHGAETTDLGWFMRSTQLLWLNWKLALTYLSESYKDSKWTVHTGHVHKTWPSAAPLQHDPASLTAMPVSISSSWRATRWGQGHWGRLLSTGIFTRSLGSWLHQKTISKTAQTHR